MKIIQGDCLEVLRTLPDQHVQMCVTSPPYWGLRDYGVEGQAGLEKTPEEYVSKMVEVFREVRRVLLDDGSLWLNLGDSFAHDRTKQVPYSNVNGNRSAGLTSRIPLGLKAKDLVGIPWMVAFALRADGWYLRSDIIWNKKNCMPESVTDRPTRSHEYIFLLTKSARYYYDAEIIKERGVFAGPNGAGTQNSTTGQGFARRSPEQEKERQDKQRGHSRRHAGFNDRWDAMTKEQQTGVMRNKRDVWTVATHPYHESHFATFPPDLIKPCVLAGSKPGDIVLDPFCGSGTSGVVALNYGRDFLGIELNTEYVKMAENRIKQEAGNGNMESMFVMPVPPAGEGVKSQPGKEK